MIRCIQIGGPNGPIVQGEADVETVRIFSTGKYEPTGFASITISGQTYRGRPIQTHRLQSR